MYTHLEDYIRNLMTALNIQEPPDLTIGNIANKLRLKVTYGRKAFKFDNEIILEPGTPQREWVLFAHEVCHYLRHSGSQLMMHELFIDLQEYQANYFSYHFCVPTFMLDNLKEVSINVIMDEFNVDYDFAARRLEIYKNKQYERMNFACTATK